MDERALDALHKLHRAGLIEARKRREQVARELAEVDSVVDELESAEVDESGLATRIPDVSDVSRAEEPGAAVDVDETSEDVETSTDSALLAMELRLANMKLKHQRQVLRLRKRVSMWALIFVGVQLAVANLFFGWYLWFNRADPDRAIMAAWLTSTVVEVIGILWVIARNLFPYRDRGKVVDVDAPGAHS